MTGPSTDVQTGTHERVLASPDALVSEGRFNLGLFVEPLAVVNPLDAELRGPASLRLPRIAKRLALKEWQHFAIVDDEVYLSLAMFDAKRIALAQVIAYERERDALHEHERRFTPWGIRLPDALADGVAQATRRDFRIRAENHLAASSAHHVIEFDAPARAGTPRIRGRVRVEEDLGRVQPLVVCLPFARGRAMYSHKAIARCSGWVEVDGRRRVLDSDRAYALVDIHKGYYPFEMKWFWATGGRARPDQVLGFNLTDNQVEDQTRYNENALWLDGRLHPLPPVRFELDREDTLRPWTVRDADGRVDLEFRPDALRRVDIDLGPLRSRYRGPYGAFTGSIADGTGVRHDVEGCYGMCEDFYLRA